MVADGKPWTANRPRGAIIRGLYRRALRVWIRLTVRDPHQICVEKIDGFTILVLPGVFDGVRLRTGAFLAEMLDSTMVPAGARVLDLGTGSGLGAIFAARFAANVVATDINPEAVRCARINVWLHHLDEKITVCLGDLFEPVADDRFDLILFNPPFYRGRPRNLGDAAWRSLDVFDRFLRYLPAHLTEDGRALVVLSTDGELTEALNAAEHLVIRPLRRRDLVNEVLTVYEIRGMR